MASLHRSASASLLALVAACSSSSGNSNPPPTVEPPVVDAGGNPQPDPTAVDAGGDPTPAQPDASQPFQPVVTLGPPDYVELGPQPAKFELDIPTGTLGFTFDTSGVAIDKVTDAAGVSYIAADRPATLDAAFRRLNRFPASSKLLAVPPGKWKIELAGPSNSVKVARQRTTDGQFHGGTLDLFVHIPTGVHVGDFLTGEAPAEAVTPANAAANPVVKQFLDSYFRELSRIVGIDRGTVTFVEADAKFVTIDSEEEQTAALSVAGPLGKLDKFGLHMLLTELIQTFDTVGFAGYASAVGFDRPFGTVLVKMKNQKKANDTPQIYINMGYGPGDLSAGSALHETAHAWGLPHTSEEVAGYDDGFTDSVACTVAQQQANPFQCPDATNVVFPFIISPPSKTALSPHQLAVLRGMPAYKPKLQ